MRKVNYEQIELHRRICEVYKKHRVQYPKRPKKNIEWFHIYAKLRLLNEQPEAIYNNHEHYLSKLKMLFGFKSVATENKRTAPQKAAKRKSKANKKKRKGKGKIPNNFYSSWEWKKLRFEALTLYGRQCLCCGFSPEKGSKNHLCVDHVKPISKHPELALDINNLQFYAMIATGVSRTSFTMTLE